VKLADPHYKDGQTIVSGSDSGNTTRLAPDHFKSTYGAMADRGLAQIDQTQRMSETLGRSAVPQNVDDAADYFHAFAKGKSTEEVRTEYQSYLKNFYVHSGDGVDWDERVAMKDRPKELSALIREQPQLADGRRAIDCEGYSYLTDRIFGGVKNADGTKRFDVTYARASDHVITGVFEAGKKGGGGFSVNNSDTAPIVGLLTSPMARNNALAQQMSGRAYDVIGFGANQDAAAVWAGDHLRPGAMVYDGLTQRLVGPVTPAFADAYDRARAQRQGHLSPSEFVGLLDQGKITP
jgi:hypothetical protein